MAKVGRPPKHDPIFQAVIDAEKGIEMAERWEKNHDPTRLAKMEARRRRRRLIRRKNSRIGELSRIDFVCPHCKQQKLKTSQWCESDYGWVCLSCYRKFERDGWPEE